MNAPLVLLQWIQLIFPVLLSPVAATRTGLHIPKLDPLGPILLRKSTTASVPISIDFKTFHYNQTVDHFNYKPESYSTFQQRYVINFKYWGGANVSAPILAYLGAEQELDTALTHIGFLTDNAAHFKALLVYIEHRYYGQSVPFGSWDQAYKNASTLGYFNSAQAIADYAEILIHIKTEFKATKSPVIVVGGSYGGMLASWFRLKYPHVAIGALASSAPILYFDDLTPQDGYCSIVTKDFREASETCYQTILQSWDEIAKVASQPGGLSFLSNKFNTCSPLRSASGLEYYLAGLYMQAAQYNKPPTYPVSVICSGIDGASRGNDTLSKLFSGVVAYEGPKPCYVNEPADISETYIGWDWQTCSEMVMPISTGNHSMFPNSTFDLTAFMEGCNATYGVPPRPNWVTTYYGGEDIKLILQNFGSNIIFSNGLRDPYSIGGVLEDISDTIVAIKTTNGSHCLDLHPANVTDPDWLVEQRRSEVEIIDGWLTKYYADLRGSNN